MTDIILRCPKCGVSSKVSEHVSEKTLTCTSCGSEIALPEKTKSRTTLRLKKDTAPPSFSEDKPEQPTEPGATVITASVNRNAYLRARDKKQLPSGIMIFFAWSVFIILAGVLCYFRFFGEPPGLEQDAFINYGLMAIGICYILIIIIALKDNMFEGLLCIVVPMYPFYYILTVSNVVLMRAFVAAMLAAFGYDLLLFVQAYWERIFHIINQWIGDH